MTREEILARYNAIVEMAQDQLGDLARSVGVVVSLHGADAETLRAVAGDGGVEVCEYEDGGSYERSVTDYEGGGNSYIAAYSDREEEAA